MNKNEFYCVEHFTGQQSLRSKGWFIKTISLGNKEFVVLGTQNKQEPCFFINISAITRFSSETGFKFLD